MIFSISGNTMACYDKLDIFPEGEIDYISVMLPDQTEEKIFPFAYQPIELAYDEEGAEYIRLAGEIKPCCRYYPKAVGKYRFQAYKNGSVQEEGAITAVPSGNHGYVGVSGRDSRYFTHSDGSGYYPIGINLAFPTCYGRSNGKEFGLAGGFTYLGLRQYERWFKACAGQGVNMARIWLGHEYFCPDTENCGVFRYEQFTKIDMLLALAKKYGIKLKLTLEQFRFFNYDRVADSGSYGDDVFRKFNKRLYINGLRCENADLWLVEALWQKHWLLKVEEFAKRYSQSPDIFAIELWNEMNCVGSARNGLSDVVSWNERMLPRVKELFPNHMVVNSLGSFDSNRARETYDEFCWELCAFRQVHRYIDQGAEMSDCREDGVKMIAGGVNALKTERQPFLVAETGAVENCHSGPFKYYANDHRGILFVDTVYTPVFLGCAGCGNIWHWDSRYVESKNLYQYFRPLWKLTENVSFDCENFKALDFSDDQVYLYILEGESVILGFVRNKSDNWKTVLRDGSEPRAVKEVQTSVPAGRSIETQPIWQKDTTKILPANDVLLLRDILYGTCFKVIL